MLRLGDNMSDSREILVDKPDAAADDDVISSLTPDVTSLPATSRDDESGCTPCTTAEVKLDVKVLSTGNAATNNIPADVADVDGTRGDNTLSSVRNQRCMFYIRVPLSKLGSVHVTRVHGP